MHSVFSMQPVACAEIAWVYHLRVHPMLCSWLICASRAIHAVCNGLCSVVCAFNLI